MKLRYIAAILAIVLPSFALSAQTASFLNVPENARDMAMGGLNVTGDASCVLDDSVVDASVSYYKWAPGGLANDILNADLSYKIGKIGVLAEARINGYPGFTMYDASGAELGNYTPAEFVAGLGAAYAVTEDFSMSLMAKYVSSKLTPEMNAGAFCADFNALYRINGLTFGLLASNLGTKLKYSDSSAAALPMLVKLGAENEFVFNDKIGLSVGIEAGCIAQSGQNSVVASAGVALKMLNMISVMAGYHFSSNSKLEPSYASAGLGFDIKGISISAAYLISSAPIGNTLGVSLGFRF